MNIKIPDKSETKAFLEGIKDKRLKAFLITQYLGAFRISEISRYTLYYPEKIIRTKSLTREQVKITERDGRKILLFSQVRNLKNRGRKTKNIPVSMDGEHTKSLVRFLLRYIKSLPNNDRYADGEIFPYTRQYFHMKEKKAIKKWLGYDFHVLNPLRHIRLTHLAVYEKYTDQQLTLFAGWTDSRPAKNYISMRWDSIIPTD